MNYSYTRPVTYEHPCCWECWQTAPMSEVVRLCRPMIFCTTCGNKRCPKATDHRLACTNSNEPGQEGSVYK